MQDFQAFEMLNDTSTVALNNLMTKSLVMNLDEFEARLCHSNKNQTPTTC